LAIFIKNVSFVHKFKFFFLHLFVQIIVNFLLLLVETQIIRSIFSFDNGYSSIFRTLETSFAVKKSLLGPVNNLKTESNAFYSVYVMNFSANISSFNFNNLPIVFSFYIFLCYIFSISTGIFDFFFSTCCFIINLFGIYLY
jgi:hypothetical protein